MMRTKRVWLALSASLLLAAPAAQAACPGDCDGNGRVAIGELVRGVNIALGRLLLEECSSFDINLDGRVSVNELIRGVSAALNDCPTGTIEQVIEILAGGDVRTANQQLAGIVAAAPNDVQALAYFTLTRLVVGVIDNPILRDLAIRSGVELVGDTSDICGFEIANRPRNGEEVPPGAPRSGEILTALRSELSPLVGEALESLRSLPGETTIRINVSDLPNCIDLAGEGDSFVEIDEGDLLLARGALEGAAATLEMLGAYELDAPLAPLVDLELTGVVDSDPDLLTLREGALLGPSQTHVDASLSSLMAGIDSILAEVDDQDDDLLVIVAEDLEDLDRLRETSSLVRSSLTGVVTLPARLGLDEDEQLDLSILFGGGLASLRDLLPRHPVTNEIRFSYLFPDPTFGNVVPDLTAADICSYLASVGIHCVDAFEGDDEIGDASQTSCGESQLRSITPAGDADWVRLTIDSVRAVRVSMNADDFATLDLHGSDGVFQLGDFGLSPTLEVALEAGSYFLKAQGENKLLYELRSECAEAPTPTTTPVPGASPSGVPLSQAPVAMNTPALPVPASRGK